MDNFYSDSIKSTDSSIKYEKYYIKKPSSTHVLPSPVELPTGQTMGQLSLDFLRHSSTNKYEPADRHKIVEA